LNADFLIGLNLSGSLREAARLIAEATGSDEAHLEAELLLCHALGTDREDLYRRLNEPLGPDEAATFQALIERRLSREPTPYITGRREFFGLEFEVTPASLIPRPETEVLVEAVIHFANERYAGAPFTMADIGVGCGTIAVAVAEALPNARVIATDQSPEALALAERNTARHGLRERVEFRQGDLLRPLRQPVDVIAVNLPYVTTADWQALPPEIRDYEPRQALDGGEDGLRAIERLLRAAPAYLRPGGALFAEIGDAQGKAASAMAREAFPGAGVEVQPDLAGRDRVLVVKPA
jgi:release factor glutamine methyltransferase